MPRTDSAIWRFLPGSRTRIAKPHSAPKAKNVIFLFMPGGVSHMESFDPKPKLAESGRQAREAAELRRGPNRKWLRPFGVSPVWTMRSSGQRALSAYGRVRRRPCDRSFDEVGVPSARPRQHLFAHGAEYRRLSESWLLGHLRPWEREQESARLCSASRCVRSAGRYREFLERIFPATHQATHIRDEGVPVDNITPADTDARIQRAKLDALLQQDRAFLKSVSRDDAVASAIANYEMGYRMQSLVPDVLDLE